MRLVLDPSVVIKWYVPEPGAEAAATLKRWLQEESHEIVVPQLFFAEALNVLWKKASLRKELSSRQAEEIVGEILRLPFRVSADHDILLDAYEFACGAGVSVYDGLYLAAAKVYRAVLVTGDLPLARRVASSHWTRLIVPLPDWETRLPFQP